MFFLQGTAISSWVTEIPATQKALGLDPAALSIALIGTSLGSFLILPVSGWIAPRLGSRLSAYYGCIGLAIALPLIGLAPSLPLLTLALAFYGASNGLNNIGINVHGVAIEERYGRPVMSSFHAIFSLGEMSGALIGGAVVTLGIARFPHFVGASVILLLVSTIATRSMLPGQVDRVVIGPRFAIPTGPLIGLGALLLCGSFVEGSMRNWITVYMTSALLAAPGLAAIAYAAYSLAMTIGRASGDYFVGRFGPTATVRVGGVVAALGIALAVGIGTPVAGIIGFVCVGCGAAVTAPVAFSAAGKVPHVAPSTGLAAVSLMGFLGGFAGSPIIGFSASLFSLRAALGLVSIMALGTSILSPALTVRSEEKKVMELATG